MASLAARLRPGRGLFPDDVLKFPVDGFLECMVAIDLDELVGPIRKLYPRRTVLAQVSLGICLQPLRGYHRCWHAWAFSGYRL